jgi:hypothetical protein
MSTRIAMQPWVPSPAVHQISQQIFPESPLKSDSSEFTYSTTNDFGKKIHKLLFCKPRERFSSHFFENVKEIGAIEGFKVQASESVYSIRDSKLRATDGMILEPTCSETLSEALVRCIKRSGHLKNHASTLSTHPCVRDYVVGVVAMGKMHRRTSDGISKKSQRESRLYFEGGDCLHLTNRHHVSQYLFGDDLGVITHQALRKDQWFNKQESECTASYLNETLIFGKYGDKITPMFLCKKIPEEIAAIARRFSEELDNSKIKDVLCEMHSMGIVTKVKFETKEDRAKGRVIVCDYLAQQEFVRTILFPEELRCSAEQVKFFPQIAYHLDMAMAPGPKGSVFLQDFEMSVQLLQTIKDNATALNLTEADLKLLCSFSETTKRLGSELKPLMEDTKKGLEAAGYHVIPTPGAFYAFDSDQPFNFNFLNCLTGYSEKTGHIYYIASGAKTDGKLAGILMDSYTEFLNTNCNNIAVYFVGRDPGSASNFSEAMDTLNRVNSQQGPHCLSFELSIAPYTTKIT